MHQVTCAVEATSEGLWSEKSKRVWPARGCGGLPECIFMRAHTAGHGREKRTDRSGVGACSITFTSVATARPNYHERITRALPRLFTPVCVPPRLAEPEIRTNQSERNDHIPKEKRTWDVYLQPCSGVTVVVTVRYLFSLRNKSTSIRAQRYLRCYLGSLKNRNWEMVLICWVLFPWLCCLGKP